MYNHPLLLDGKQVNQRSTARPSSTTILASRGTTQIMPDAALDDNPRFPPLLARNLFGQRALALSPSFVSLHLQVGRQDDRRLVRRIVGRLRIEKSHVRL